MHLQKRKGVVNQLSSPAETTPVVDTVRDQVLADVQATLGAAVGHLCWHKKIGNKALLLGAMGGTIPDLDIILYPLLDDIQRLHWHRGESHSIWFVL